MLFNEDQMALKDSIRRMVEKEVLPLAAEIDDTDRFPVEWRKTFGQMGLLQMWVPEEYGGANMGYLAHMVAMEEISRASASIGRRVRWWSSRRTTASSIPASQSEREQRLYARPDTSDRDGRPFVLYRTINHAKSPFVINKYYYLMFATLRTPKLLSFDIIKWPRC